MNRLLLSLLGCAPFALGHALAADVLSLTPVGLRAADAAAPFGSNAPPQAALVPRGPLQPKPPRQLALEREAQREAVRRFPELGVAGSRFNRSFNALYSRYQTERPDYFKDPEWPIRLAEELARDASGT